MVSFASVKRIMIELLFEDDYCIIVNKPNNVLVHHSYYSRNITDDSLLQLLKKQFNHKYYPVHRLDRKTSGLILLAKDKIHVSKFQTLFTEQNITKKYLALTRGHCLASGKIDTPIKNADTGVYKDALTLYQTLNQTELEIPVKPYSTSRYSLLELEPKTGRMHQLRKHLNKISHPIIGDHKYGNRHHNKMFTDKFGVDNLYLHAYSLAFIHPITNKDIKITKTVPEFWNAFFKITDWKLTKDIHPAK
jgi:tRNA pseudouridine65 synthase